MSSIVITNSLTQIQSANQLASANYDPATIIASKLDISAEEVSNIFELSKITKGSKLAEGINELIEVPTGQKLLKKIIELAKGKGRKISFCAEGTKCETQYIKSASNPDTIEEIKINIPDDAFADKRHPFLVKTGGENFGIVRVAPPPAQVVAHELGHGLHFLESGGTDIETEKLCAKYRYQQLLGDVLATINDSKVLTFEKNNMRAKGAGLFLQMWNQDNFTEIINILPEEMFLSKASHIIPPKATILPKKNEVKKTLPSIPKRGFPISDGIILHEIIRHRQTTQAENVKFYDQNNNEIDGNTMRDNFLPKPSEQIIRFGHESAVDLGSDINDLSGAEKLKFGYLTNMLLSKIGMTVNSLPACQGLQVATATSSSSSSSTAAIKSSTIPSFPFLPNLELETFKQKYTELWDQITEEAKSNNIACFSSDQELIDFGGKLTENISLLNSGENLRDTIAENKVFDLLESKFGQNVEFGQNTEEGGKLINKFKEIKAGSTADQIKEAFKDGGGWDVVVFPDFKNANSASFGIKTSASDRALSSISEIKPLLEQIKDLWFLYAEVFPPKSKA
ncbi:MAG: type III secretion system effector protein [Puniceicoccales bacterium]|jgi:hypothetical protein|nr:type III secretion system effector protein [Puniceicoccales bacterium]